MPNLELVPKKDLSSFRKIAIGTWETTYDPSIYGTLEIRMDETLRYIEEFRRKTGKKLTISHMIAKATAMVFAEVPDANAILRWNRIYLRQRIGVFSNVVMTDEGIGKVDLSGAVLYDLDKKSVEQIYDEFQAKVEKVRARKDPALEKTRGSIKKLPYFLLNFFFKTVSFLSYTLNLDLRAFGIPNDPFGSAIITNVGSLGLDFAYVPLVPYSRVPMLLAVGAVKQKPVVDNGTLKIGNIMNINATFDHRIIDGFHASVMSKVLREWMEHPYDHFDKLDGK